MWITISACPILIESFLNLFFLFSSTVNLKIIRPVTLSASLLLIWYLLFRNSYSYIL